MSYLSILNKKPNRRKKLSLSGLSGTSKKRKTATKKRKTTTRRKTSGRIGGSNPGAAKLKKIQARAKQIKKAGEAHSQAVKRASQQLKKEGII